MNLLRRVVAAASAVGLVGAAVVFLLRWVDSAAVPVVVAQSAFVVAGLLALACTVVAAVVRAWWVVAAGVALVLPFAGVQLPTLEGEAVAPSDQDLTVVAVNLEYGEGRAEDVMAQVRRVDADVVVLVEVDRPALDRLDALGLSAWDQQSGIPLDGAAGLVVRAREPLEPIDWGPEYPQPWAGAVGRLTTPQGPVVVRGVHTVAPNLGEADRWHRSMSELRDWSQGRHQGEPTLLAGDFNADWGHPSLRAAAEGFTDAHRAAGDGWVRTWPVGRRTPPFTQLDHVLVRGLDVVDAGTFAVSGTDHRGVWARVRLPTGP